jgi:uncharacterized membrane protein
MLSAYLKIILLVLVVGLLTACGAQSADTPASAPTEEIPPATQPPSNTPGVTETTSATEVPATATEAITTEPAAQGATISFAGDVFPIIQSRCVNCHGGQRTEEGLVLTSHASVMAGSDEGAVVIPGDAANSLLVELVAAQKMPKRGPKLTPPQIQIITDWVNQGALNN